MAFLTKKGVLLGSSDHFPVSPAQGRQRPGLFSACGGSLSDARVARGPHPLGLLQLLRELLQGCRMSLSHVLDLSFMVLCFFLKSLLQLCHLLFPFGARETFS